MRNPLAPIVAAALCVFVTASALAQEEELNPYAFLSTADEIATVINGTNREILISSRSIYHEQVAEAIRRAIVTRGVQAFILTTGEGVNEPASYLHSLFLAGANVRIGPESEPIMLLDREAAVSGPLITGPVAITDDRATFLLSDARFISTAVNHFIELYEAALPFEYVPTPPAQ